MSTKTRTVAPSSGGLCRKSLNLSASIKVLIQHALGTELPSMSQQPVVFGRPDQVFLCIQHIRSDNPSITERSFCALVRVFEWHYGRKDATERKQRCIATRSDRRRYLVAPAPY